VKPKRGIALLFVGMIACASNPLGPSAAFRHVATGIGGPFSERTVQVVRDAARWNELLLKLQSQSPPGAVDFASEMVIIISPGMRSPCYGVTVDHVEQENQRLIVAAIEEKPAPGCVCSQIAVSPYEAVAVTKSDASAEAKWSDRTRQCGG
jgi:hypothetical protein